jgi:orotate phosphoribosyltransferase
MKENTLRHDIAAMLLGVDAVRLRPEQPFQWASGWLSPIYCDNRLTLSYPEVRSYIKLQLTAAIKKEFPQAEGIAGVATAGIPQGVLIADQLNLPFLYVRSGAKGHGLGNQIEGRATEGSRLVVVEDLISTGKSSLSAILALREAGYQVEGVIAIFSYGFPLAAQQFDEAKVPLFTLTDYIHLIQVATTKRLITNHHLESLENWRRDPQNWSV